MIHKAIPLFEILITEVNLGLNIIFNKWHDVLLGFSKQEAIYPTVYRHKRSVVATWFCFHFNCVFFPGYDHFANSTIMGIFNGKWQRFRIQSVPLCFDWINNTMFISKETWIRGVEQDEWKIEKRWRSSLKTTFPSVPRQRFSSSKILFRCCKKRQPF